LKRLHADPALYLPHANTYIEAGTCEQLPIRAPCERMHSAALVRKPLHERFGSHVPNVDEPIIPSVGELAPIRSKGYQVDVGSQLIPEQATTLQVPQLEVAVPAPTGQESLVRAEGEGRRRVGMRLPDEM